MPRLRVDIWPGAGRWRVHHNFYDRWYATEAEAIAAALAIAEAAARRGHATEVLLRVPDAPPRRLWPAGPETAAGAG